MSDKTLFKEHRALIGTDYEESMLRISKYDPNQAEGSKLKSFTVSYKSDQQLPVNGFCKNAHTSI